MKKTVSVMSVFVFLIMNASMFSQANFLQWVKSIGSVNSTYESGAKTRVDDAGNMFVLGRYAGTMDADPSLSVTTISLTSTDTYGFFLAKYDAGGNFIWVKTWRTSVYPGDFEINTLGDIIIGISGQGDVDPGAAVSNQGNGGVLKLDFNGVFKAFYPIGTVSNSRSETSVDYIALDKNNNIIVSGYYFATNNVPETTKALGWWKLSANGNLVYTGSVGSNLQKNGLNDSYVGNLGLETDSLGDIYALAKNYTTPGGNISSQSELTKFASTGAFVWKKTKLSSTPVCLAVGKGVYAMQGGTDKYDFAGNPIWNKTLGSYLLKCDKNGNLYSSDYSLLKKHDKDGNLIWSTNNLKANSDFEVDTLENVYWTGFYNPTFTCTVNGVTTTLNTNGGNDHCFGKLSNCIYDAPNICLVTVDSLALNNVIYWDPAPFTNADSFIVYRYDAFTTAYLRIGAKAFNQPNFLIDTARTTGGPNGGNPQYSSYRYKLAIRGTCGAIGTKGLYHESIFIQQNSSNFSWNAYGIEGQTSPATGYQFMRDNINNGTWQVLVNTGGLSTTDPNYLSYPNGNWRVDALGFSCNPTAKLNGTSAVVNRSKSNIKNNFVVTSASEIELNANISLSPNPAKSELLVHFSNHQQTKTEFVITDVLGKVVYKTETLENEKIIIPLNEISSGVYFLKIKQGKLHAVKKFVKE